MCNRLPVANDEPFLEPIIDEDDDETLLPWYNDEGAEWEDDDDE